VLREPDGRVHEGALRVRFGEVEARGVALTAAGRQRYDEAISEAELLYAEGVAGELPGSPTAQRRARDWPELLAEVWRRRFPSDERSLACSGLACYTVHAEASAGGRAPAASASLDDLLQAGLVGVQPVVYEDFLPRSAAGIFRSNLTSGAQTDTGSEGAPRDSRWLAGVLERPVHDPQALYRDQVERSVRRAAESLGIEQITLPG
jgi:uncharacterized glyoxalase superfamily metalloenzyme YdcJ